MVRIVALIGAIACGLVAQQPQQPPPTFRGRTVLVPVDVRVIDKDGKPITGLTQADFRVIEDDVPQEISQFSTVSLTPEPGVQPLVRTMPSASSSPQNRRVFLLLLGSGKLQPVSKGLDALISFARKRVMPQDQLAIFAYNRGTDFTTNHEYIASVLERYRTGYEAIEARIRFGQEISDMYGRTSVARPMQEHIDDLFRVPGGPPLRTPNVAEIADLDRIERDDREARNAMLTRGLAATWAAMLGGAGGGDGYAAATSPAMTSPAEMRPLEVGFGDFVGHFSSSMNDLARIYQGIEYLRAVEGEKHLVFVTERGMYLPRLEDHTSVAAMAADARVAIDVIQTGGLPKPASVPTPASTNLALNAPPGVASLPTSLTDVFVVRSLNDLSKLTGGQASIYAYADKAVDRIIAATGFSYLLGYSPSNTKWDGRYRDIKVEVTRKGATVLYRHGYYGKEQLGPFDRRKALTYRRIALAANGLGSIRDINVSFTTADLREQNAKTLLVKAKVDPARIVWTQAGGDMTGAIDIAVFCSDQDQDIVGEQWQHVDLRLPAAMFDRAKQVGLSYEVRVPVKTFPTFVKLVVYDYASDLVGTAFAKTVR